METMGQFEGGALRLSAVDVIEKLAIFLFSTLALCVVNTPEQIRLGAVFLLLLNAFLVIRTQSYYFSVMIFVFILWMNYSIFAANYYLDIHSYFLTLSLPQFALTGYRICMVFTAAVCFLLHAPHSWELPAQNMTGFLRAKQNGSTVLGAVYIAAYVLILIFAYGRPSESGARGTSSALYEYSVLLFVVGYYYFSWNRAYRCISIILMLLFALQTLAFGGRITALQIFILLFVMRVNRKGSISWTKMVPLAILMIAIFAGIGELRGHYSMSVSSLGKALASMLQKFGSLDTAYSSYFISLTFLRVEAKLNMSQRLQLFRKFILSIFAGSRIQDSNLSSFTRAYYTHYYGGTLSFYGHFYLGYFGVICLAGMVANIFNQIPRLLERQKTCWKCIVAYLVATTPRWYLYTPSALLRGTLLLVIVFYLTQKVDAWIQRKTIRKGANP